TRYLPCMPMKAVPRGPPGNRCKIASFRLTPSHRVSIGFEGLRHDLRWRWKIRHWRPMRCQQDRCVCGTEQEPIEQAAHGRISQGHCVVDCQAADLGVCG